MAFQGSARIIMQDIQSNAYIIGINALLIVTTIIFGLNSFVASHVICVYDDPSLEGWREPMLILRAPVQRPQCINVHGS